jgi:hypothetical protein
LLWNLDELWLCIPFVDFLYDQNLHSKCLEKMPKNYSKFWVIFIFYFEGKLILKKNFMITENFFFNKISVNTSCWERKRRKKILLYYKREKVVEISRQRTRVFSDFWNERTVFFYHVWCRVGLYTKKIFLLYSISDSLICISIDTANRRL